MITPVQDFRRTAHRLPQKPYAGLDASVHAWVGRYHRRPSLLKHLQAQAERVDSQADHWHKVSDRVLREQLQVFQGHFRRRPEAPDLPLESALAALREVAERQIGLRPFVEQLMGAIALHRGCLSEMATGEGKTLTAGLAAVLAGWTSRPCHIITANDYLVQRDAEWIRPLYRFCGLQAGFVTSLMNPRERRAGYACEVTYTTSKELVADFLRDRLQLGPWQSPSRRQIRTWLNPRFLSSTELVMRGLHTAIVDEADCLLIDEAVTPLIISAAHDNPGLQEAVRVAYDLVADLQSGLDYQIDHRHREVRLTGVGQEKIQARAETLPRLFQCLNRREELVQQALVAREFFHREQQYVLADGKVTIVDEFTGRVMPQRTWRAGLHQAIEAKEHLPITAPAETLARLSFQRFFRLFHRLAGMTGTAREAAAEFWHIYNLPVLTIPTHRPCIRRLAPDGFFPDVESKWSAVVARVRQLHATGRPILIGTRSVAASEHVARRLQAAGFVFRVLNAIHHKEEAQIVATAGERSQITIATNMAGRGTDIKLGEGVVPLGGLHVLATERHESSRIDRQLFGRSARQGDPGSAQAFVSFEDDLLRRHLPAIWRRQIQAGLRAGAPGIECLASAAVTWAQHRAQRLAFRQRHAVLKTDTWLEEALAFSGPTET